MDSFGDASTTARDAETPARATRAVRPGWRNPRLLIGVLLVAGCVLGGARLLAAADDSVGVWSVRRDLPAGATLERDDLEQRQVRFPDAETADRYVAAASTPPAGTELSRAVSAGELLPRAVVARQQESELVELPVSVLSDDLPATVRQGSVVDVWVSPKVAAVGQDEVRARQVLADVVVVSVPQTADRLAPQTTRQVIVGVPADQARVLGPALGGMADGRVVVTRQG